jgi:hypothetical protein
MKWAKKYKIALTCSYNKYFGFNCKIFMFELSEEFVKALFNKKVIIIIRQDKKYDYTVSSQYYMDKPFSLFLLS